MFERYTERARRAIFFARYEASQFGSTTIETEHFLLGLLREDANVAVRILRDAGKIESLRQEIESRTPIRARVSTSIDLPLSNECRRILAYAADEAERLSDRHVGTEHLLLGILREENCMAAQLLRNRELLIDLVREELAKKEGNPPLPPADRASVHALVDQIPEHALPRAKWLLEQLR